MGPLQIRHTTNFPTLSDYKTREPQSVSPRVPENSSLTSNITHRHKKKETRQIVRKYFFLSSTKFVPYARTK